MPAPLATTGVPRTRPRRPVHRLLPVCLPATLIFVLIAAPATADPPAEARVLAPDDAQRAGLTTGITRRQVGGQDLLEAQLPPPRSARAEVSDRLRLLATSPGGEQVATADQVGSLSASLTIQRPDGTLAVREMPGVVAAQFTADGSALLAVDGRGALWRLATATAEGTVIAPGSVRRPDHPGAVGRAAAPQGQLGRGALHRTPRTGQRRQRRGEPRWGR